MPAFAIGQVVESRSDDFAVGDIVTGHLGWQDYAVVEPDDLQRLVPDQEAFLLPQRVGHHRPDRVLRSART